MRLQRLAPALLLIISACNKAADVSQQADVAGPRTGIAAAPGMSLSYAYGFRLPVERIAPAQEQNASQCEALGPENCQITGLRYEVGRDRTVSASLDVKLTPDRARQFGKDVVAAVSNAGGMLTSEQIDSENSGATIAAAHEQSASLDTERMRIEKQLQVPGLGSAERQELQQELAKLASDVRDTQSTQRDAELKLATTPMSFQYSTGEVDKSLSEGPIIGAIKDGWVNVVSGISVIIMLVITLIPWALCSAAVFWLLHRISTYRRSSREPRGDEG